MTNKKLTISPSEWEQTWGGNPFGPSTNVRPQCEDFEYQFDTGDLIKLAPGFNHNTLCAGDIGVVIKRIVMYSNEVKSDGPAYKVAWQKRDVNPTDIREFKLVPAKKK